MPRRTPSGKPTAVASVEDKLAEEAQKKGLSGKRAGAYVYGTLQKVGLKKGNKTTPKGMRAAKPKTAKAFRPKKPHLPKTRKR